MTRIQKVPLAAVLGLVLVGSVACGGGPPTRPHKLASGRTIRVISVGKMYFSHDKPSLILSYQTDLKVDQMEPLRAEVAEIWKDFQKEVDRANLTGAIINGERDTQGSVHPARAVLQFRLLEGGRRNLAE